MRQSQNNTTNLIGISLNFLRKTNPLAQDQGQWRRKCNVVFSCRPQVHRELSES